MPYKTGTGDIQLTAHEWRTVESQCSKCVHWDDDMVGCAEPHAIDPSPVEKCGCYEAKGELLKEE